MNRHHPLDTHDEKVPKDRVSYLYRHILVIFLICLAIIWFYGMYKMSDYHDKRIQALENHITSIRELNIDLKVMHENTQQMHHIRKDIQKNYEEMHEQIKSIEQDLKNRL